MGTSSKHLLIIKIKLRWKFISSHSLGYGEGLSTGCQWWGRKRKSLVLANLPTPCPLLAHKESTKHYLVKDQMSCQRRTAVDNAVMMTSSCLLSTYYVLSALVGPRCMISFNFCSHPRNRCCFDLLFQREKLRLKKTNDLSPGLQLKSRGARPEPQIRPAAVDTDHQGKPSELCLKGQ